MTTGTATPPSRVRWRALPLAALFVAGVVHPVMAVAVEESTRVCTDHLFDPLPTVLHTVLFLAMAGVNLALCMAARHGRTPGRLLAGPLWGGAFAIALWYSAVFLIISPLSLIGILCGVGLLGFAPMTSLWALWGLREPSRESRRGWRAGALAGMGLLCAADLPASVAHLAIVRASSEDPAVAESGLVFLRGSLPDAAIRDAARHPPSVMSPLGVVARFGWRWRRDAASVAFWRATGEEPPRDARSRSAFWGDGDEDDGRWLVDDVVGRRTPDLCLASSALDGDIDTDTGVADLAWTLVFRNESEWNAEARSTVALPAGAVVSDATLWVNGQPCDAVFGGRVQTQRAYEAVVAKARDPLLVTSEGRGRVLVRCFPVPPRGEMKIRLRIAAPLADAGRDGQSLDLPRFAARNFGVCSAATHTATLRGGGTFTSLPADYAARRTEAGSDALRADGEAADFVDLGGRVVLSAPASARFAWTNDPFEPGNVIVCARESRAAEAPPRLVVVVDASRATAAHRDAANALLAAVPDGYEVAVLAASDRVVDATGGPVRLSPDVRSRVRDALAALPWAGGVDDLPALRAAGDLAATVPGARVLWLHGPQTRLPGPVHPGADDGDDTWRRPVRPIDLTGVRVAPGSNVIADGRGLVPTYEETPSVVELPARLRRIAEDWYGAGPSHVHRLGSASSVPAGASPARPQAARALAALWALGETERLASSGDAASAIRVAARHRVVTSVSGAVVLENDEQYKAAGLKDLDPGEIPTVPEPGEWAVIAAVAVALGFAFVRRRRAIAA